MKRCLILGFVISCVVTQKVDAQDCPAGFSSTFGRCYYFSADKLNYADARTFCQNMGTDLAVITSRDENEYLSDTIGGSAWIGYEDIGNEGDWKWIDGRNGKDHYSNWTIGQPDNHMDNEHCCQINWIGGAWNDRLCTDLLKFICQDCPAGTESRFGHCYFFSQNQLNYPDARTHCQNMGGDQAVITSSEENDYIGQQAGSAWIGLNDMVEEGNFQWVDGKSALDRYSKWGLDQPDDYEGVEDCVHIGWADNTWNDIACHHLVNFVCQTCPAGFKSQFGRCYYFSEHKLKYTDARAFCQGLNADLVVIESQEQNDYMRAQLGTKQAYIGLTDIVTEGTWEWVDGKSANDGFRDWNQDQPDNYQNNQDCALINRYAGWDDVYCLWENYFICQRHL